MPSLGFLLSPNFGCGLGVVSLLLWYLRRQIQGYWFDRQCPAPDINLRGRVALITGGTAGGLGYATAVLLLELGATVVLTFRSEEKARVAIATLEPIAKRSGGEVSFLLMDFLSISSVREGAATFESSHDRLDFLVLNAGVSWSADAPAVWQTNYLGQFVLVEGLRELLEATADKYGGVRVVAVSSGAHTRASIDCENPFELSKAAGAGAYGQSKLAQIMHMRELQRRINKPVDKLCCVSITPGLVGTNLVGITLGFWKLVVAPVVAPATFILARSTRTGAQVMKMACISPNITAGGYYSNCYEKPTKGKDDISNDGEAWKKLWALSEKLVQEGRFP